MRTYDFTPLFRSTVGFDRLSRLMDTAPNWKRPPETVAAREGPTLDAIRHDLAQVPKARLIVTLLFVVINLVVDILYGVIDPRIRYE